MAEEAERLRRNCRFLNDPISLIHCSAGGLQIERFSQKHSFLGRFPRFLDRFALNFDPEQSLLNVLLDKSYIMNDSPSS
jgi:hypothetical protein